MVKSYDFSAVYRGQETRKPERGEGTEMGEGRRPQKFSRGDRKGVEFDDYMKKQEESKDVDGFQLVRNDKRKRKNLDDPGSDSN